MKKLMVMFGLIVFALTVSACGNKEDKNLDNYKVVTEITDDTEITFWHAFGDEKAALLQEFVDEFEAANSKISVTLQSQGGYTDLRSKVVKSIVTGDTPTMLIAYPDHVADYIEGDAALSLDPFIDNDQVGLSEDQLNDYVESYLEENKQFGKTMGLPFNKSTEVLIYNKTYFDDNDIAVPTTWDDVEAISRQIKADDDSKWGFAYDSTSNAFITLVRQWGGKYTNADGDLLFNNDEAIDAISYFEDMHEAGLFTVPAEWEQNYASDPFKNEDVYMTVGSTAGISYNIPANGAFDIGVAPIPQNDSTNKQVIQQGTNMTLLANSTDQERLAAWLLMKYLSSPEVTTRWAIETGYLPVRKSALNGDVTVTTDYAEYNYKDFLDNPTEDYKYTSMAANAAYDQVDYMFYDNAFVGSSNTRDEVGLALESVLYGDNITPKQAIEDAIAELDW